MHPISKRCLNRLQKAFTAVRDALHRLRLARANRRITQLEDFLAFEQCTHAEQMLWLRTELAAARERRTLLTGEAPQYRAVGAME